MSNVDINETQNMKPLTTSGTIFIFTNPEIAIRIQFANAQRVDREGKNAKVLIQRGTACTATS